MYAKGKATHLIEHWFPVVDYFYSNSLEDTHPVLCAEKAHHITDKARKVN